MKQHTRTLDYPSRRRVRIPMERAMVVALWLAILSAISPFMLLMACMLPATAQKVGLLSNGAIYNIMAAAIFVAG